jgi:hypothetical protein
MATIDRTVLPIASALVVLCSAAHAQDPKRPSKADISEAQAHFARATDYYSENDYAAALIEFRRANELAPTFRLWFNIGQVCYQLKDYPGALDSFTRYLAEGGSEVPAQRQEEVEKEIERLRNRVATVRITTNLPNAEIAIDDVIVGKSPLADPVVLGAGRRRISAALKGHPTVTKVIDIAGLEQVAMKLEFVENLPRPSPAVSAAAKAPPVVTRVEKAGTPIVPWVVSGVLAVGAGVTAGMALMTSSELKERRAVFGSSASERAELSIRTRNLGIASDALLAATVVMVGISSYLTFFRSDSNAVAVSVGPTHIALEARF